MSRKIELKQKLKSTGATWLMFLCFGLHYAYLGKWGLQILYWLTLGGLGIWTIVDFFSIGSMVRRHNQDIYIEIEQIEKQERQEIYNDLRRRNQI